MSRVCIGQYIAFISSKIARAITQFVDVIQTVADFSRTDNFGTQHHPCNVPVGNQLVSWMELRSEQAAYTLFSDTRSFKSKSTFSSDHTLRRELAELEPDAARVPVDDSAGRAVLEPSEERAAAGVGQGPHA